MKEDPAADLGRLHGIVEPDAVPWWPLAPGWYWLAGLVVAVLSALAWRGWRRWRASAHRREALRRLAHADQPAAIASLLRRTALAEFPRREVAGLTGEAWLDWLARTGPEPPSPAVREQLLSGVYSPVSTGDPAALREWAGRWIRDHRSPAADADAAAKSP